MTFFYVSSYEEKNVYIAFRHFNCTDQYKMQLDEVSITKDKDPVFNIYENGTKIDQVTGLNHYEVTLTQSGSYTYCISFAGEYCESAQVCADSIDASATVTFSGLDAAPAKYWLSETTFTTTGNITPKILSISGLLAKGVYILRLLDKEVKVIVK